MYDRLKIADGRVVLETMTPCNNNYWKFSAIRVRTMIMGRKKHFNNMTWLPAVFFFHSFAHLVVVGVLVKKPTEITYDPVSVTWALDSRLCASNNEPTDSSGEWRVRSLPQRNQVEVTEKDRRSHSFGWVFFFEYHTKSVISSPYRLQSLLFGVNKRTTLHALANPISLIY